MKVPVCNRESICMAKVWYANWCTACRAPVIDQEEEEAAISSRGNKRTKGTQPSKGSKRARV
jgi:hypothetical protein